MDSSATGESDANELPGSFDCRGQRATQVLAQIVPFCLQAREAARKPHLIIENLGLLEDSVTRLLKALSRLSEDYEARIALSDNSGFTTAFLEVMPSSRCVAVSKS